MKIILKGGGEHEVDGLELRILKEAYPRVDVEDQLRRMAEWCRANPHRRKTERGVKRFINAWLQRSPEKREQKVQYAAAHRPFEEKPLQKGDKATGLAALAELKRGMKRKNPNPKIGA